MDFADLRVCTNGEFLYNEDDSGEFELTENFSTPNPKVAFCETTTSASKEIGGN